MLNKTCTRTAKSAPYPPCTVTTFWPRWRGVPGPCPDASSGNTTSPYCRAVSGNNLAVKYLCYIVPALINFLYLDSFCFFTRIKILLSSTRFVPYPAFAYGISRFCFYSNLQNRTMSSICKLLPSPRKPLFSVP